MMRATTAAGLLGLVMVLGSGCSGSSSGGDQGLLLGASASGSPSTTATPRETMTVTAYFVRADTTRLWVEPERRRVPKADGVAKASFQALVEGNVDDPALKSLAPKGTRVLGVSVHAPVLTVDLSGEVTDNTTGGEGEEAFAQQLALTAAQFKGVTSVLLHVDGKPVSELWGHSDWSKPVKADKNWLSPVDITSPAYSTAGSVGSRVTLKGKATVFEATVSVLLTGPSGERETGHVNASCGGPCRGDWTYAFRTRLTPGRWIASAWESSAKDGSKISEAKVVITVPGTVVTPTP